MWEGTDADVATKEISVTADGTEKVITLTATASGKVSRSSAPQRDGTLIGWKHDDASYKSEVVDGVTTTTMTFKYTLTAATPLMFPLH